MKIEVPIPQFDALRREIAQVPSLEVSGRVTKVVGLVIEASGPNARVGTLCYLEPAPGESIRAEVVGFRGDHILLMPLGDIQGIRAGCRVRAAGEELRVPAGPELLGRCIDGLGNPIDDLGPILASASQPVNANPPAALTRQMIQKPFATGVRAIDSVLTMGVGQRVGIFAGSGVGKSTLLGMIARSGQADVNVIALVGERGREVKEFVQNDLGEEGLRKSVLVCATSDEPALVRLKAAMTATAIAEHFRNRGLDVLLMMDSVTRFAMAQREVGLAAGEPPSSRGYTPSVFALLAKLMERTGCGATGAITAIYTVLVDGDDTNEPISDATRAILDGHIFLSRALTGRGHYPPIDILQSLSRVMPFVTDEQHIREANRLRELLAAYSDVEDLVSIGAYKAGSKPIADEAIAKIDSISQLLRQDRCEGIDYEQTRAALQEVTRA